MSGDFIGRHVHACRSFTVHRPPGCDFMVQCEAVVTVRFDTASARKRHRQVRVIRLQTIGAEHGTKKHQ